MDTDRITTVLCEMDVSLPYEAKTIEDMYALADLIESGYVEASVTYDESGVPNRGIGRRITLAGRAALEELASAEYVLSEEDVIDRKDAVERFYSSQQSFDKTMSVSASGGVAVGFSLAGVIGVESFTVCQWIPLMASVLSWTLTLISVLWMHDESVWAHERYIDRIDRGERCKALTGNDPSKKIRAANRREIYAFMFGVVMFALFLISVASLKRTENASGRGVVFEKIVSTNLNYRITDVLPTKRVR